MIQATTTDDINEAFAAFDKVRHQDDCTSSARSAHTAVLQDGDGSISAADLGKVLGNLGTNYNAAELQGMVDEFDHNKSGRIEVEEFHGESLVVMRAGVISLEDARVATAPADTGFSRSQR